MNPIPLKTPAGIVAAWMCGKCFHVPSVGARLGRYKAPGGEYAVSFQQEAERCCRCRRCDGYASRDTRGFSLVCKRCEPAEKADSEEAVRRAFESSRERERLVELSLAKSLDRDFAMLLRDLMGFISEDLYCAGWLIGLEFTLWGMVQGDEREFGMGEVSVEQVEKLRQYADRCGGWWRWSDGAGEVFVPKDEWLEIYQRRTR